MLSHIDHLVLTTADIEACVHFYTRVLGMTLETFGAGRLALKFGRQKINLHEQDREFEPKATHPTPGSIDLCLIAAIPLDAFIAHCTRHGVKIIEGPVSRTGAISSLRSIYLYDPDGNLVEVSEQVDG